MAIPARYNVLGVGIHALTLTAARDEVVAAARERATRPAGAYVCFCDVNSVSCARRDPAHLATLNRAFLATPDGMPLVWLGRRAGYPYVTRVYGPDLMLAVCAATAGTELTHFFYGGGAGTVEILSEKLRARFPGLRVAGTHTPPFRDLSTEETVSLETRIRELRPDFFWVGLSTPKQEKFMATFASRLDTGVMLGVGAAFDFLSGNVRQAPRWIQRSGLEWLFRLCIEPRRLAPRYFKNNPLFVLRVVAEKFGLKKYPPPQS
jgi:N-acetylglucosaminyldiphosphoundecaprenol N-acetyl-beta-D-mannosaminyltransferase